MDEQTDRRELSQASIRERILATNSGDEVRFNDRIEPLDVLDAGNEYVETEITVRDATGTEIRLTQPADDGISWTVGEEFHLPAHPEDAQPATVEGVETLDSTVDRYALSLDGPRGGRYRIFSDGGEIKVWNESADEPFAPISVFWFENCTRTR